MATITSVLAQATVRDLPDAETWYEKLFGRAPDTRPMEGLVEWHLGGGKGVQVWQEPERAGGATVVLEVDDLDEFANRVRDAGLTTAAPQEASAFRILPMTDADGNRIVVTGQ